MRATWGLYCENTDGLVYVVDSTDTQRLEDSRKEFEHILKNEYIKNVGQIMNDCKVLFTRKATEHSAYF